MVARLRGVDTLYNTYWVRFPHGGRDFEGAVRNSAALIQAAVDAGVRRLVHVSIANPSRDSALAYYRGKAMVEDAVRSSGIGYAIVRPTVIYGHGDVLINNIAWFLRHLPVFGIAGDGSYGIQPVFIEDHADLVVDMGSRLDSVVVDSVGPDVFTFDGLVRAIRDAVGSRTLLAHLPPALALLGSRLAGAVVHDVVLTEEEMHGLMDGLLVSRQPPTCRTTFQSWLDAAAPDLGRTYSSELARHFS
jgi:NADH dehydrogenase